MGTLKHVAESEVRQCEEWAHPQLRSYRAGLLECDDGRGVVGRVGAGTNLPLEDQGPGLIRTLAGRQGKFE